ncbi:hypothetical protein ACWC24_24210 [Streptomyces sp. NPDC001443]
METGAVPGAKPGTSAAQGAGPSRSPARQGTTPAGDEGRTGGNPEPTASASRTVDAGAAPDLDRKGIDVTSGCHLTLRDDALRPTGDDTPVDIEYHADLDRIRTDARIIPLARTQKGTRCAGLAQRALTDSISFAYKGS